MVAAAFAAADAAAIHYGHQFLVYVCHVDVQVLGNQVTITSPKTAKYTYIEL